MGPASGHTGSLSSHVIHQLLGEYGLLTVFLATAGQALFLPIPGSTVLIAAAVYAASPHGLPILGVLLAAFTGVTAGGLGGFGIGRWRGEWVLLRLAAGLRQPPERVHRLRGRLARHAVLPLIGARWFTGTRNLAGIAAGASGMGIVRFAVISALAALIWSTVTSLEFYFFGGLFLRAPTWVQVLVGLASIMVGLGIVQGLRRRRSRPDRGGF